MKLSNGKWVSGKSKEQEAKEKRKAREERHELRFRPRTWVIILLCFLIYIWGFMVYVDSQRMRSHNLGALTRPLMSGDAHIEGNEIRFNGILYNYTYTLDHIIEEDEVITSTSEQSSTMGSAFSKEFLGDAEHERTDVIRGQMWLFGKISVCYKESGTEN